MPRVLKLDNNGRELRRGSVVYVFPDTEKPDVSQVSHFTHDWLGWRVHHSWLTGYHPDEPDPSEPTERLNDGSYRCNDLELVETAKEAATGCQEGSSPVNKDSNGEASGA